MTRVGLIGAGVVGSSWALVFARAGGRTGRELLQVAIEVRAQQPQLLGVLQEQLPRGRQPQRPRAHHQHRADQRLERAQPL